MGPYTPGKTDVWRLFFFETWGLHCRDRFDAFTCRERWQSARSEFVRDACQAIGLPAPSLSRQPPPQGVDLQHASTSEQTNEGKVWSMRDLPKPNFLKRDQLWTDGIPTPQLEFVVDNQSLANISNGTEKISNDYHQLPLSRIQIRLLNIFIEHLEYKDAFLDPADCRPREFNSAADHVANCVLYFVLLT